MKSFSNLTKDGAFEVCYIATADDAIGLSGPFPLWEVQYMNDGTQEFFDSESDAINWILSWYDITPTKDFRSFTEANLIQQFETWKTEL